ncbi:type II toxin-antitoxin system VapB family antitoxin [Streptomyces kunmingensis]|uniref:Type II toxin-antitoxin system VapB family antitoxin n=1 Tax=Streptomyces kunmingensis TaxID=68225 RepID=A0ABU6CFN5_9ACTN|nr:type II toxin-antitoxin system VapB family antitoxin [Streptomyces kunmingensis]MEB3963523.1 type II toxin-antitoxin system VapB family antitoxin [Streptomyces kunmingensis]
MKRTGINLDDQLVADAAKVLGTRTEAETVDAALREVLATRRRVLELTCPGTPGVAGESS